LGKAVAEISQNGAKQAINYVDYKRPRPRLKSVWQNLVSAFELDKELRLYGVRGSKAVDKVA
jgi:hypothetical protein